jgi:hypothetical protein
MYVTIFIFIALLASSNVARATVGTSISGGLVVVVVVSERAATLVAQITT